MLPKWFEEARFGMFIHWGLYAKLGGVWKGQDMDYIGEWIQARFRIPNAEYSELAKTFNPVNFNADEWMRTASAAGVKYIVFTSKHHDGFAMYHTKVSPYNIYDATPFHRDPLAELAAACKKYGVRLGIYYSHHLDWHEPNGGDPGPDFHKNANMMSWSNDWDFPDYKNKNFRQYFEEKVKPQVTELLTNYGPVSILWCDCPLTMPAEYSQELRKLVKSLQPECLINQRIGNGCEDYCGLGDNQLPLDRQNDTRESPVTLNHTWGFKYKDKDWKTPQQIVRTLASLAGRNTNLLLNIGPQPDGAWPEGTKNVFAGITPWMQANGSAVFATKSNPFPVELPFGSCTMGPKSLNLFLEQPQDSIELNGIQSKVRSASVPFTQDGETVKLDTHAVSDPLLSRVTVYFDETPKISREYMPQNGTLILRPRGGKLSHGTKECSGKIGISADGLVNDGSGHSYFDRDGSLGGWQNPADHIAWDITLPAGKYRIRLETQHMDRWDPSAGWIGGRVVEWTFGTLSGKSALTRESGTGSSGMSLIGEICLSEAASGNFILRTVSVSDGNVSLMNLAGLRIETV